MQVLLNTFDAGPHEPGALVLDVRNENWQMEVRYYGDRDGYHIYLFALSKDGEPVWALLADHGGETPAGARFLARKYWRDIAVGSP